MARDFAGRTIALVGICAALLAVSLPAVSGPGGSARYVDDGTVAAFLIVLIALASWLPAEVGPASLGGAMGAAAFGFFLWVPAQAAFAEFRSLDAGAWLGLCAVLIPVGALVRPSEQGHSAQARTGPAALVVAVGLALLLVGIWLPVEDGGASSWNLSASGHALGILLILLVAASAVSVALRLSDVALLLATTTFGLAAGPVIANAFGAFGSLGSGAWLGACGGLLLVGGVVALESREGATTRSALTGRREPDHAAGGP